RPRASGGAVAGLRGAADASRLRGRVTPGAALHAPAVGVRITGVERALNHRELRSYVDRVADHWPIEAALLGGARVADERGAPPQRERGPEFVLILISSAYDGMPWLERVYQAGSLWDALEMGAAADVHCYTPTEFERKRISLATVRAAAADGLDLLTM